MAGIQGDSAAARNLSILQSGKYSDMTICCDKIELRVHQAIVCPASDFFARAFGSDFKEAHTRVISLEEHVDIVKMMLLYIYTHDYDDQVPSFESYRIGVPETEVAFDENTSDVAVVEAYPSSESYRRALLETKVAFDENTSDVAVEEAYPSSESYRRALPETKVAFDENTSDVAGEEAYVRMTNNVSVHAIADKYDIPGLKKLAETKFEHLASVVGRILRVPAIIHEIYGATLPEDSGLRGILTNICVRDLQEIVRRNEWVDAMREHIDFTIDLLRASAETY